MNAMDLLQQAGPTTVGLVFLWAGIVKLASRGDFRSTLWHIPHLPPSLVPMIGWLLPLAEIATAIGLILHVNAAKAAAIVLLAGFCILAMIVMKAKLKVPCNCFGSGDRIFSGWTIIQSMALLALVSLGFRAHPPHFESIALETFASALILIALLSFMMFLKNSQLVKELRKLNAI